jgi:hypothetical protein
MTGTEKTSSSEAIAASIRGIQEDADSKREVADALRRDLEDRTRILRIALDEIRSGLDEIVADIPDVGLRVDGPESIQLSEPRLPGQRFQSFKVSLSLGHHYSSLVFQGGGTHSGCYIQVADRVTIVVSPTGHLLTIRDEEGETSDYSGGALRYLVNQWVSDIRSSRRK